METILLSIRDRHEDLVHAGSLDRAAGLVEGADDRDPLDPAPSHPWVVVEEADDPRLVTVVELAGEPSAGPTCPDDQYAPAVMSKSACLGQET